MNRADERRRRLADAVDLNRLQIFLPVVMSAGLAFWLVGELRELARSSRERSRDKQAALASAEVARLTLARRPPEDAETLGLRPRAIYLLLAGVLVGASAYLSVGQYIRQQRNLRGADPGVSGEAWLLALGMCAACIGVLYGVTALIAFLRWRSAPAPVRGLLIRSPLTTGPVDPAAYRGRASRRVTTGIGLATLAGVVLAILVGWTPNLVRPFDRSVASWIADLGVLSVLDVADPLGRTDVALGLAVLVGLAALRCRVLAASYAAATAAALVASGVLRPLVAHARPPGILAGGVDSFPSGHTTMAVLFAGALPLAIAVLLDRRAVITPLRVVLGLFAAASAVHRVGVRIHWPTDAIGGALIGLVLVLAVQWSVDNERSHQRCRRCLWSHRPAGLPARGVVGLHVQVAPVVRGAAHLSAAAVALGLFVLANTRGLPVNPEGVVFGEAVQRPAQLFLAGMVSVGALAAWRWHAVGAVILALAGSGLALFASVQYPPVIAVAVSIAVMVPAVLLWLSWQHDRLPHEILAVAVITSGLIGVTWIGSASVYEANFGRTHPSSKAARLAVDRVEWVWTGALTSTSVTVSVRLPDDRREVQVVAEPKTGGQVRSSVQTVDEFRIAQVRLSALAPGTTYAFRVVVDGVEDTSRGSGTFRTPRDGPLSFRFAAASCARVGANGAVFDAIRSEDPLFYLALGDIHYGDITSTETSRFIEAYDRLLTTPGQAALYREVPIAYVWDDHDYGDNDADASSPSRRAAREAYRAAVPHHAVPPGDAPIYQAFTVGRVRFILTDSRSERTPDTLLGEEQMQWLLDELQTASETHALVVWGNPIPWIQEAAPGADGWGGYPEERRRIADAIADAGIENLLMVSGDAHMVAIDDGTNSDYSTARGPGFPVLHAAALDRRGSVKGGPYSEGAFPGGGQYGTIDVEDDGGGAITVRLTGKTWDGEEVVSLARTFAVPLAAGRR